jgi:hypothetical protein
MSAAAISLAIAVTLLMIASSALAIAVAARRGRGSTPLLALLSLPPFLALVLAAIGAWHLHVDGGIPLTLRNACVAVGLASAAGWWALRRAGWRRNDESGALRAKSWSLTLVLSFGLLATAGCVVSIFMMDRGRLADIAVWRASNAARRVAIPLPPAGAAAVADLYRSAATLAGDGLDRLDRAVAEFPADSYRRWNANEPLRPEEMSALKPIVTGLSSTLQALEEARTHPAADFGVDPRRFRVFSLPSETNALRGLARLSSTAARVAAAEGDREAALTQILVMDRISEHLVQQPTFLHILAGLAVRHYANATFASVSALVDADDPRLLDRAFDDALAARVQAAIALERCDAETTLLNAAEYGNPAGPTSGEAMGALELLSCVWWRLVSLPAELRLIEDGFASAHAATVDPTRSARGDAPPDGSIARVTLGGCDGLVSALRWSSINADVRRAVLAIRASSSGDVASVPLPTDPSAADGQALRLRRVEGGVTIYGVGPNRVDDGGPGEPRSDDQLMIYVPMTIEPPPTADEQGPRRSTAS